MTSSYIHVRIDDKVKKEAQNLFKDLGLDMSKAVNLFLRQCIREQRIPFDISLNVSDSSVADESEK